MKSVLGVFALVLLLLFTAPNIGLSSERPAGWYDNNESHPWGGDEGSDPDGGIEPTYTSPRASEYISSGIFAVDMFVYEFVIKPIVLKRNAARIERMEQLESRRFNRDVRTTRPRSLNSNDTQR